jgi:ferritin-like metal-binding protein YciE
MKNQNLRELFIKELQDLYDAENQIIKTMPKLVRSASEGALTTALEQHLEIAKDRTVQLEDLFSRFGEQAVGKRCKGMEGLLKETEDISKESTEPEVKDAALIASAQKIHHYQIAGFGTARTYAHLLGESEAASVLERILSLEKDADARLSSLAEEANIEAVSGQASDSSWRQTGASSRSSSSQGQSAHLASGQDRAEPGSQPPGSRRQDV